jgi:exopolysaccharide production protein ExoZ
VQAPTQARARRSYRERLDDFFLLNQDGRFAALEGLRAWAILSVFAVHFNADWSARKLAHTSVGEVVSSLHFNHLGVDLFFVISGFLIYRLLTRKSMGFGTFMLGRYHRLLPAHVAVILLATTTASLGTALANVSFLNFFVTGIPPLNYVTWSLSYEILFYLLCALALVTLKGRPSGDAWLLAFAIALLVSYFVLPDRVFNGKAAYRMPDVRFMGFFAGIAVARIYETRLYRESPRAVGILGIAGFLWCIFLARYVWGYHYETVMKPPLTNLYYLGADLGFALVCLAAVSPSPNPVKYCFTWKPLRIMGIVSYSFYLTHAYMGLPLTNRITDHWPALRTYGVSYALGVAICMAIATFLFHYLEKPYFRYRHVPRSEDAR